MEVVGAVVALDAFTFALDAEAEPVVGVGEEALVVVEAVDGAGPMGDMAGLATACTLVTSGLAPAPAPTPTRTPPAVGAPDERNC